MGLPSYSIYRIRYFCTKLLLQLRSKIAMRFSFTIHKRLNGKIIKLYLKKSRYFLPNIIFFTITFGKKYLLFILTSPPERPAAARCFVFHHLQG